MEDAVGSSFRLWSDFHQKHWISQESLRLKNQKPLVLVQIYKAENCWISMAEKMEKAATSANSQRLF